MTDQKTPARLKAEHLVDRLWRARVLSVAEHCLSTQQDKRCPVTIYPPSEREYKECECVLWELEPKSELSLAMPADEPTKRQRRTK